ncbi:MAG: PHB depolymerase family esterase [Bdellovibrionaceae bacterium]|nr:PHB depolymerase family esterase [Pseudobdellovibrionaceae bacterium]
MQSQAVRSTTPIDISRIPSAPPAPMTYAEYSHDGVTRRYALFSPPSTLSSPGPRPLLVLLHGCNQTAETFAQSTRMNELAIRENAFVLYPEQSDKAHPLRCWNWFDPRNHTREASASERAWLASLITSISTSLKTNPSKTFIAGLSAGAAMTVNMLSCHPDLFAAGAVFAGVPFAAAHEPTEGLKAMKSGTSVSPSLSAKKAFDCGERAQGKPVSVFIAQGDADPVVDRINATQILKHFEALNDLRDDSQANGSFSFQSIRTKAGKGRRGQLAHALLNYKGQNDASAKLLQVKKLGHAWSGGQSGLPFSEPRGPSASDMMWEFFSTVR